MQMNEEMLSALQIPTRMACRALPRASYLSRNYCPFRNDNETGFLTYRFV
jgi:hypothetical protein